MNGSLIERPTYLASITWLSQKYCSNITRLSQGIACIFTLGQHFVGIVRKVCMQRTLADLLLLICWGDTWLVCRLPAKWAGSGVGHHQGHSGAVPGAPRRRSLGAVLAAARSGHAWDPRHRPAVPRCCQECHLRRYVPPPNRHLNHEFYHYINSSTFLSICNKSAVWLTGRIPDCEVRENTLWASEYDM